jgi:hypothetical protein
MDYKNLLYFDIETVSQYENINTFKDNDDRGYNLFIRKIKRNKEWIGDENELYLKKSPLIPEFGKIVCITVAFYKNDELKMKSIYDDDELNIIKIAHKIFKNISDRTTYGLCGYYIKNFDIPWLNKKFLLKTYNVKPWDMNVFDLSDMWNPTYSSLFKSSFDEMLYSLDINSPKDIISGEDVNNTYWIENNIDKIKDYCEKDVTSCINAYKKIYKII